MSGLFPAVIEGLEVSRRGKRLLGPLSMRLEGRGLTIILGPNGAGKTTLLRALHGLERPSAGRILWPLAPEEALRRQAFVFQAPILMRRSALDNIAFPLQLEGAGLGAAREAAAALAARVGLKGDLTRPAHGLSGGERQKLALARALARSPDLLLLDEPCASLDGRSTREIEAILQEIRASGVRILMSTHDMGQARRLADEALFLSNGRLLEHRPAADFFNEPLTPEARAHLKGDLPP